MAHRSHWARACVELHHVVEEGGFGEGVCDEGVRRVGDALEREHLGDELMRPQPGAGEPSARVCLDPGWQGRAGSIRLRSVHWP